MTQTGSGPEEVLSRGDKLEITKLLHTVSIHVHCADEYAASVLFHSLVERLESGGSISLQPVRASDA